jgi:hypothetical protein
MLPVFLGRIHKRQCMRHPASQGDLPKLFVAAGFPIQNSGTGQPGSLSLVTYHCSCEPIASLIVSRGESQSGL